MIQTAFLESLINKRHTILGRRLHDLCIHDAIAMGFAGNPLWIGGREPSFSDLEEAVLICSLPPARFTGAQLAPRTLWERLMRGFRLGYCTRRMQSDPGWFNRQLLRWNTYVEDYFAVPAFWESETSAGELRAPVLYSMAVSIEMHTNMSMAEILAAPIGLMFWKSATIAERLGISASKMMTQEEIEIGLEQEKAFAAEEKAAAEKSSAVGDSPTSQGSADSSAMPPPG